jgi:hypothetical protein
MFHRVTLGTLFALTTLCLSWNRNATAGSEPENPPVAYRTVKIDGVDIFYREAGPKDAPAIRVYAPAWDDWVLWG